MASLIHAVCASRVLLVNHRTNTIAYTTNLARKFALLIREGSSSCIGRPRGCFTVLDALLHFVRLGTSRCAEPCLPYVQRKVTFPQEHVTSWNGTCVPSNTNASPSKPSPTKPTPIKQPKQHDASTSTTPARETRRRKAAPQTPSQIPQTVARPLKHPTRTR